MLADVNNIKEGDEDHEITPVVAGDREAALLQRHDDEGVAHMVSDDTNGESIESQKVMTSLDEQWRAALAEMNEEELSDDPDEEVAEEAASALFREEDSSPTSRMGLSKEELEWAQQIKSVIEEDPELDNLTDFEYVQYALAIPSTGRRDGLVSVLERAHQMQALREDKKLLCTCSHAKRVITEAMKLFPGYLLSLHLDEFHGGYTFVFDSTKLIASEFSSNPQAYNTWISSLFYVFHAANPDFESMRQGTTLHVECDGFDFATNFGIRIFSKVWSEGGVAYPIRYKALKHFHTSMFKNLMVSMAKRFIPQEIHQKFQVGCVSGVGRLDKAFLTPNAEEANERFQNRMMENLQTRFDNEKAFSLS